MTVIYIGNPYEVKSYARSCTSNRCVNNVCDSLRCVSHSCNKHRCNDKTNIPEFEDGVCTSLEQCYALSHNI